MLAALPALMLAMSGDAKVVAVTPAKPRLICREGDQMVGSHIRTRRCKTEEEWRRDEEARSRLSPDARVTAGQNDGLAKEHSN